MGTAFAVLGSVGLLAPMAMARESAPEPPVPSPLPLDWCLERAGVANPEIAVDAAARDAANQRVGSAGRLEDPRFAYLASNLPTGSFDLSSTPLSGHQLALRQKLPFPGTLSNRRAAAESAAEAAGRSLDDRRLRVASDVEIAWADLGFAQRALDITQGNIELVRQLSTIAEARYRVGTGLQQDVLRAQVELTSLLQESLERQASIETAGARLASLLDVAPATRFPRTTSLGAEMPVPDLAPLLAAIESRSPRLLGLRAQVERARKLVRVSELEGYPDFDLGLGYRIRQNVAGDPVNGDDFLSLGVTLRLPVDRSKWRARVAERRAQLRREEANYRTAMGELASQVRSAHAQVVRADAESSLLASGLVPQAEQSLESSRSGYEVGRIDFLSLLDSQVRLLDARLRLVRARADRHRTFAALEAAAGERLR